MSPKTIAICAVLLLQSRMSFAQNPNPGPQGAAFGTGPSASARQRLNFTFDLAEGLDSLPPPEATALVPTGQRQAGGYSTILVGMADYRRARRRLEFDGTAVSAFRYYGSLGHAFPVSHSAALGTRVNLPARSTFEVNQQAAFSPSFLYQLFPSFALPELGDALPPAADYRTDRAKGFTYNSRMTLASRATRGNNVSATGEFQRAEFQGGTGLRPEQSFFVGRANWSHGVGRRGMFSTEYEYQEGEFGFVGRATNQRLRFGTDYSSRRVTFRLNVTPAMQGIPRSAFESLVRARADAARAEAEAAAAAAALELGVEPEPTEPAEPAAEIDENLYVPETLYRLEGDVSGEYRLRRTWSLNGSYSRRTEYVAVFRTPVFNDAARLTLGGLVSRRIDVSASAAYSAGLSALNRRPGQDGRFETRTGTVRVRYAVARSLAFYSEYLYYFYDLRGQSFLAPGLARRLELHGGRVGLMLWVPTLGR